MSDPKEPPPPAEPEKPWAEEEGSPVVHLTDETFATEMKKRKHVLVMFYAPWCGHCKRAKPEFTNSAKHFADESKLMFVAVDCTKEDKICQQNDVQGFPTMKYFSYLKHVEEYIGGRTEKDFSAFMTRKLGGTAKTGDGKPAVQPSADDWDEAVIQLDHENFASLESAPYALVMFFAPWCGHCKRAKPEFIAAAKELVRSDSRNVFAAVDCTKYEDLCKDVSGYPTFNLYENGIFLRKYTGGRKTKDFLEALGVKEDAADTEKKTDQPDKAEKQPEDAWDAAVKLLDPSTFKQSLGDADVALVMFYAPWCHFCKEAKPEFIDAAKELKAAGSTDLLAAVDCTKHDELCDEVKGFPTFKLYVKGKYKKDHQGRNKADFLKTVREQAAAKQEKKSPEQPAVKPEDEWEEYVPLLTPESFGTLVEPAPAALVMFFAPWCGHCKHAKPEFAAAAKQVQADGSGNLIAAVDCTVHKDLCQTYDVKGYPTFKLFRKGEHLRKHEGGRSKDDFVASLTSALRDEKPKEVKRPSPPKDKEADAWDESVHLLTPETFSTVLDPASSALVMFYAPWCGHCKRAKPEFTAAAKEINVQGSKSVLAAVDCTVHQEVCQKYEVRGYPTFKLFKEGRFLWKHEGGRQKNDFIASVQAASKGEKPAEPEKPAPPKDEDVWDNVVKKLDATNFDSTLQPASAALVMFFAPWCGHCKHAKPQFIAAAKKIEEDDGGKDKVLAAVDCTQHRDLCQKYEVRGYPTIKLFKNGKFLRDHAGGRGKDDFIKSVDSVLSEVAEEVEEETEKKPEAAAEEDGWDSAVVLLDTDNFEFILDKAAAAVVMFFRGCERCKTARSEFNSAARKARADGLPGVLAAVDCLEYKDVCQAFDIKEHPAFKLFKDGKFLRKHDGDRNQDDFIALLKDGLAEQKPPEPEKPYIPPGHDWSDMFTLLTMDTFNKHVKPAPAALVMFFAPWCAHCKNAKADFAAAAKQLQDEGSKNVMAGVDCTQEKELCRQPEHKVQGYPTLNLYRAGRLLRRHDTGRTRTAFYNSVNEAATEPVPEKVVTKTEKPKEKEKPQENFWGETVLVLNHESADSIESAPVALVMFFTAHCQNCERAKPEFIAASKEVAEKGGDKVLAVVDCNKYKDLCKDVDVFPTFKLYRFGTFIREYGGQTKSEFLKIIKNATKEKKTEL